MLKVEIDQKDGRPVGSCTLMGTEKEIAFEVLQALGTIYSAMRGELSTEFLYTFRRYLIAAVLDPASPVWTTNPKDGNKIVFKAPGGQN